MSTAVVRMPVLPADAPLVAAYPILLGTLDVPHGSLYETDNGTTITTPLVATLLVSDGRPIVVDNGYDVNYLPRFTFPNTLEEHALEHGLWEHDMTFEEVQLVVNTHLHSDHGGMNRAFPEARICVQEAEYRYAFAPDERLEFAYRPSSGHRVVPRDRFDLLSGNVEIAPGVWVVHTPGHTPGHQAVVAHTASGWVVIAGDAAHARTIWEGEDRAAVIHDDVAFDRSVQVLRGSGCLPLFSHDLEWTHDEMKESY